MKCSSRCRDAALPKRSEGGGIAVLAHLQPLVQRVRRDARARYRCVLAIGAHPLA